MYNSRSSAEDRSAARRDATREILLPGIATVVLLDRYVDVSSAKTLEPPMLPWQRSYRRWLTLAIVVLFSFLFFFFFPSFAFPFTASRFDSFLPLRQDRTSSPSYVVIRDQNRSDGLRVQKFGSRFSHTRITSTLKKPRHTR